MKWVLQTPPDEKGEMETLEVFENGRIICTCLNNLYFKGRNINSVCRHAQRLREDIIKGELENYYYVKGT